MRTELLFGQKKWAVVGQFDDENKRGYQVYRMLKDAGFIVYPVSKGQMLGNDTCYTSLSDIPAVDVVSLACLNSGCILERDLWHDPSLQEKFKQTVFWVEPSDSAIHVYGVLAENGLIRVGKGLSVIDEYAKADAKIEGYMETIVQWLKDKVEEAHSNGVVVGISGGVDSAVVASLAKRAFGDNAASLILPCYSSPSDAEDGIATAEACGIEYQVVDLTEEHAGIMDNLFLVEHERKLTCKGGEGNEEIKSLNAGRLRVADSNLRARLRMATIYAYGNYKGYLVLGTDNAAEVHIGYYTKYGDGGVDLLPIAELLKCEVFHMARKLGVPESVIYKAPSAGLWEGQTDENEIGVGYDVIDSILMGEKVPEEAAAIIERLHRVSEHKRHMPPHPALLE